MPFKPGQEQLCQPAAMRAIFEENCETGQEVKYDIFKPFLSLCVYVCVHARVCIAFCKQETITPCAREEPWLL